MENSTQINPAIATIGIYRLDNITQQGTYDWYTEGGLLLHLLNNQKLHDELFGKPPTYDNTQKGLVDLENKLLLHAMGEDWEFNVASIKNVAMLLLLWATTYPKEE